MPTLNVDGQPIFANITLPGTTIQSFSFFFLRFMYLKAEPVDMGDGEMEIFCLLVYLPKGGTSWVRARLKPEAGGPIKISHVVAGSSCCPPRCTSGKLDRKWSSQDSSHRFEMGNFCLTALVPISVLLFKKMRLLVTCKRCKILFTDLPDARQGTQYFCILFFKIKCHFCLCVPC